MSVDEHLRTVLAYIRELGADHETALLARYNLANERVRAKDVLGALVDVEIVIRRADEVLGAVHRVTLAAKVLRASIVGAYGDRTEAVAALERLVPEVGAVYGASDPVTLSARLTFARNRDWSGLPEAAAEEFRDLLRDYVAVFGDQDPATRVVAAEARKWTLEAVGSMHEAHEIEELTSALSLDDPDSLRARYKLAFDKYAAEDYAGAVAQMDTLIVDAGDDVERVLSYRCARILLRGITMADQSRVAQLRALLAEAESVLGAENQTTQAIAAVLANLDSR